MKVILQQDVKGQGKKGQLIEVSDGYGRNFLLPRKLAVEANEQNMALLRQREKVEKERIAREKAEAAAAAEKLKSCVVRVKAKAGEGGRLFGSVTSKEICEALQAQCGVTVQKQNVIAFDPIKAFGTYEIKCRFGYDITGIINVIVTEG